MFGSCSLPWEFFEWFESTTKSFSCGEQLLCTRERLRQLGEDLDSGDTKWYGEGEWVTTMNFVDLLERKEEGEEE